MQQIVETIQKNAKEQLRVEFTEFEGHDLLGIRVCYAAHYSRSIDVRSARGIAHNREWAGRQYPFMSHSYRLCYSSKHYLPELRHPFVNSDFML
jgi:hypothetical protein